MGLKNKKKIIVVVIITLIVSISTVSYALWTTTHIQTGQNSITTGCLDIKFTEGDSINITNGYPITDEAGKKSKGTEFSITNTCTIPVAYEVVLDEITTTLADNNLKINVSGSREIEPVLLSEMSETDPVPLTNQSVSSAKSILKDVVPGAEASGQTGGKKTYVLRLWIRGDISTNLGSGKEFKGRIAIRAYQINKNDKILVNNIIANNPIQTETPDFGVGFPNENTNEEEAERLSGLYKSEDDQGESYYFRGAVENNYVKFGKGKTINNQEEHDLIWRIVRINGDGSVRLVSQESVGQSRYNYSNNNIKAAGYTYDNERSCTKDNPCTKEEGTPSIIKSYLEDWYQSNLSRHDTKIATSYFCNDTSMYENVFGTPRRLDNRQPSLRCPNPTEEDGSLQLYGGVYKLKIGLLSADELNMAGLAWNNASTAIDTNYLYFNEHYSWTLSPWFFQNNILHIIVIKPGNIYNYDTPNDQISYTHPVINLKPDVQVTGEGTKEDPYQIIES